MEKASKENNFHYNPELRDRANYLLHKSTQAEVYLWKYALSKNKMGVQFLRQRPVLNYIADFMCKELLLIIEVDGATHLEEETQRKDNVRQKKLESIGFKVIRLS